MVIRAKINESLERRFRELAMKKFGYSKGALKKAAEEAILKWISTVELEDIKFEEDPVEAIEGLLSGTNMNSVDLQHKIKELWMLKVVENLPD